MYKNYFYKFTSRSFLYKFKNKSTNLDNNNHLNLNKEGVKISFYSKAQVSKDGYILRFLLPNSDYPAGFKTCQYVMLEGSPDYSNEAIKRLYHPISMDSDKGFVDILIKVYEKNGFNKEFGIFSNYLANLQVYMLN